MLFTIGWLILVIITLMIGSFFLYVFLKDKDKRKLIFSIIFVLGIITFIYKAFNLLNIFSNVLIIQNLYHWSTIPVMTAIFLAVVESYYKSKDFQKEFKIFMIFSISSLILIFLPFQIDQFLLYYRLTIAFLVILISTYELLKLKNFQSLFFLVSMISFSIAGIANSQNEIGLAIFAYAIAYFCLGSVFSVKTEKNIPTDGIGSYFTIKKELQDTKSALAHSQKLYKSIVENTQDVILLTKPNGENSYVSPSSKNIFGYSPEELTNVTPWPLKVYPKDQKKVNEAMINGFSGSPGSNLEYRIFTKNGELRWISHSWKPISKNGKIETIVSSIKDISNLKQTQRELANRLVRLQENEKVTQKLLGDLQESVTSLKKAREQIQQKNSELEKSKKELQILNDNLESRVEERTKEVQRLLKQKDAFIDQLGHDLKHPLGPFINLIPLLKKQETNEKKIEILNVLERNVDYMKRLVIRTIKLAKLNAPSTNFNFQSINFSNFVDKIIEKNVSTFQEKDISIDTEIESDIILNADALQLEEVIENLFSNAIKYGAEHGTISISAKRYDNQHALISINDSGQGMRKEQVNDIFNEFYKTDESRHDFTSTGLGLSICKRIVEKHNGKIWAESDGLGKGTTIHFTIPLSLDSIVDKIISV